MEKYAIHRAFFVNFLKINNSYNEFLRGLKSSYKNITLSKYLEYQKPQHYIIGAFDWGFNNDSDRWISLDEQWRWIVNDLNK